MPPRRRTVPPPIDVEDLKSRLDQGKIVRVAIANGAQFPAGATGRVRSVGDPAVDGDEFIHVEVSVNGTKDLLPFAPADLTVPTRVATDRNGSANGATEAARAAGPAPDAGPPGEPLIARMNGSTTPAAGAGAAAAVDRVFFDPPAAPSGERPAAEPPSRPKVPRAARPAAKRKGPAVAISIGTTDADPPQWRLEARVGAKVVVRNGSVPPARVWELVGRLGDEALSRAVGTVLDEQRQAAQARADALAAELAAVRAELADLPQPGRTS